MRRLIIITMTICGLCLATACKEKKFKDYEQTDSGLYYKFIVENNEARQPVEGDYLFLTVSYRTDNDSIIFEPREVLDLLQPSSDLFEAYSLMHEGDEAAFILKADSFFLHVGMPELPDFITEETMIFFNIKLNKVSNDEEELAKANADIQNYLQQHGLQGEPTADGLYYFEQAAGKGAAIVEGDTVSLHYTFKLLNDTAFDTSIGRDPIPWIVGNFVPGIDEGLKLMKRGGKATMIMPYTLAFGPQNPYIPIPAFSSVVAEIEVLPNLILPQSMMPQPVQ
ncbi:MAG: FKBP-type peptidyl-prolyl cis-trans isomerase [Bacteroidales bacterium]|nr:FKBP-type peptidyl-prolyl cis-trans isomerase [Bacteroidales bacterium]